MVTPGVLKRFQQEILPLMGPGVRPHLEALPPQLIGELEEIRLRLERPLAVVTGAGSAFVAPGGRLTGDARAAYLVTVEDLRHTLEAAAKGSWYALTGQLGEGFITVPGGHRLGLAGEAVTEAERVSNQKNIGGIAVRMAKEVPGCASAVIPYLWDRENGLPYHTLIVSPPRAGKTTVLREIVRTFSSGFPRADIPPMNVGLVDERWEIAACFEGVPQNDVGPCTDVLSGWPKAKGMLVLVRTMSPRILATDEMGGAEDLAALEEVLNAGVKVVATAHAADLEELGRRPLWRKLFQQNTFERYVVLSRRLGPGTVEAVWDASRRCVLFKGPWRGPEKAAIYLAGRGTY